VHHTAVADHFSDVAARYAAYRPTYPPALVDFLREVTRGDTAWDAGCGNGQLTLALVEKFERVIGTDLAAAQLAEAAAHPRIEYRVATAEDSEIGSGTIDLAVAAQAAHWFDWPRFAAEVTRVTHPGSTLALIGYRNPELDVEVGVVVTEFIETIAGPYWPAGRVHINNGYRDLILPGTPIETPAIEMAVAWTREELLGYASSWSATNRLHKARGSANFEAFCARIAARWPADERRRVRWPVILKVVIV